MGEWSPPYYGTDDAVKIIEKIAKVDEKINELAIEREGYVKTLKAEIKKLNKIKD